MVFHSLQFLTFFAVVVAVYFAAPLRSRWIVLLGASLYFYGVSEPFYLVQILAATALSFWLGLKIEAAPDKPAKKRLVTFGIVALAANLIVFKYTSFFNETLRSLFGMAGWSYSIPVLQILLPIGISFYTFQLIGYLVDVFRGSKAEHHAGRFALFVTFFPKLVAGPIERGKNLLPQLHLEHRFDYQRTVAGLQLILWGAFKKVVVADRIAPFVQQVYDQPHAHDGVAMTLATWLYAFQIYCDFSGYTDIALGVAAIFGYQLMQNFNRPYFATSIQDFWKRWHISLTSWLTDYIYTPLTRQRVFKMKFYNLMLLGLFVTFLVSGFWHGAQWTFVAWGALHGLYIVISLQTQKQRVAFCKAIGLAARPTLHRQVKIAVTFTLVCFAYILFRANSMADALYIMSHLHTGWTEGVWAVKDFVGDNHSEFGLALLGIAFVMAVETVQGKVDVGATLAKRPWLRWSTYYAGAVSIALLGAYYGIGQQFIYFRF
ncbi:MAG TPA: MBOAT family O-acyltransferase [Steroidobacter sp.]|uniref:MBOAT family O-acyltransferase n=1 Tax=Steroidobacter sp. TaxID=1978227 RepID=UPI002ED911EC